jgi:hypothetical protein
MVTGVVDHGQLQVSIAFRPSARSVDRFPVIGHAFHLRFFSGQVSDADADRRTVPLAPSGLNLSPISVVSEIEPQKRSRSIPPGVENACGINNATVDPSSIETAFRTPPLRSARTGANPHSCSQKNKLEFRRSKLEGDYISAGRRRISQTTCGAPRSLPLRGRTPRLEMRQR